MQFNVRTSITEVVRVIEMQAASKNIKIEMDYPARVVLADKQRI